MELPKLNEDDYLNKDSSFWKEYREILYKLLLDEPNKLEKTPGNIVLMAKQSGIKPTARYFNIQPSQVRYYLNKDNKK